MLVKDLIHSIKVTPEEHTYFVGTCSDWSRYCDAITNMDKLKVLKLLKYLIDERPYSNRLLQRAISRFNRLNALQKGDLK